MDKATLRKKMLQMRADQDIEEFEKNAAKITDSILESVFWKNAGNVALFASLSREFPTAGIIEKGWKQDKKIFLPKIVGKGTMIFIQFNDWQELQPGPFSLREPKSNEEVLLPKNTLMLVPGLAFDDNGWRLGYGGGYYDRYLAKKSLLTVAPCQSWQIQKKIYHDKFDIPVKYLFTENGLLCCRN